MILKTLLRHTYVNDYLKHCVSLYLIFLMNGFKTFARCQNDGIFSSEGSCNTEDSKKNDSKKYQGKVMTEKY